MMTKGYLLDTNIVSYLIRGLNKDGSAEGQTVLEHYQAHEKDASMFICAVTTGEMEYGLYASATPSVVATRQVRHVLDTFPEVLKMDKHVASNHYATLRAEIFKRYAPKDRRERAKTRYIEEWLDPTTGKTLGINENDVWIAAVALTHNLTLVTSDKMDHIKAVAPPELSVLNWMKP